MLVWLAKDTSTAVVDLVVGTTAVVFSFLPVKSRRPGKIPSVTVPAWKRRFRLFFRFAGLLLSVLATLRLLGHL